MIKIPTIFKRNYSKTYAVLDEPNPECQWVFEGHGIAYRKWQGMAALIDDKSYYRRAIIKKNQTIPKDFILIETDKRSGKLFGWLPVIINNPSDVYYVEAYDQSLPNGTYELIGPQILGGHESVPHPILMSHTAYKVLNLKRDFQSIKKYLKDTKMEGIVFHHPDGRMAKIKGKDFGLVR